MALKQFSVQIIVSVKNIDTGKTAPKRIHLDVWAENYESAAHKFQDNFQKLLNAPDPNDW